METRTERSQRFRNEALAARNADQRCECYGERCIGVCECECGCEGRCFCLEDEAE